MKFVYCLDEQVKEKLVTNGFKLLRPCSVNNKTAWVFICGDEINKIFQFAQSDKFIVTDTLTF